MASSIRVSSFFETRKVSYWEPEKKKKKINNWIRTIMYSFNTQVFIFVRVRTHKCPGVLFAKHKIQRTRTIYDFVGVPRNRVRRTEYRLRMVGIRRTRKRGIGSVECLYLAKNMVSLGKICSCTFVYRMAEHCLKGKHCIAIRNEEHFDKMHACCIVRFLCSRGLVLPGALSVRVTRTCVRPSVRPSLRLSSKLESQDLLMPAS